MPSCSAHTLRPSLEDNNPTHPCFLKPPVHHIRIPLTLPGPLAQFLTLVGRVCAFGLAVQIPAPGWVSVCLAVTFRGHNPHCPVVDHGLMTLKYPCLGSLMRGALGVCVCVCVWWAFKALCVQLQSTCGNQVPCVKFRCEL